MENIIEQIIDIFTNPWVIFGFVAQFVFFLRFVVQWLASEKAKSTVVPVAFWYLSITGAIMILIYSIYRQDIVFISGQVLALGIYVRNLHIYNTSKYNTPKEITDQTAPTSPITENK